MPGDAAILAIETSCDETSAAVLIAPRSVRSNVVSSQVDLHARYGGIVPEIAARAHVERISPIVRLALDQAGIDAQRIDAIAVTEGPGLVGSLLIGVTAARTLALLWDRPLVAVDHIHAHAVSAALACDAPPWPAVSLVVSGGHTSLYLVRDTLEIELLGQTRDDAAGEAFDKIAAILELGYPGGPAIQRAAEGGDPHAIAFPRAWMDDERLDFSFSGLKTAVLYHVYGPGRKYGSTQHLSQQQLADIAASAQEAIVDPLVHKTLLAARRTGVGTVTVGGGVAANRRLRQRMQQACAEAGLRLVLTPMEYCTDNAAMIALLGAALLEAGRTAELDLEPRGGLKR